MTNSIFINAVQRNHVALEACTLQPTKIKGGTLRNHQNKSFKLHNNLKFLKVMCTCLLTAKNK